MFIVGIEPLNRLKGTRARLFLRENKKSHFEDVSIPHIWCTRSISESDLQHYEHELSQRGLEYEIKPYTKSGKVIQVRGPRELKLPNAFHEVEISTDRWLAWQRPTFKEYQNGKIGVRIPRAKALEDRLLAIDIETDKQGGKEYSRINTVAIVWDEGKEVYSVFDFESQREFVQYIAERIREIDPLFIGGQNLQFDLLNLRDLVKQKKGDAVFRIGVDGSEPKIKGQGGLVKKVTVPGRLCIDLLGFAQHWLWSPSNKLEALADFLGERYKKRLEHGQLERLIESGQFELVKQYCLEDASMHYKLVRKILPWVISLAYAFRTNPESICCVSKYRVASQFRDRRYFSALNTFRKQRTELDRFALGDEKINFLEEAGFKSQRGFFKDVDVFYTGYLGKCFRKATEPVINYLKSKDNFEQIIYAQAIDAWLGELVYDLKDNTLPKDVFYGRYRINKSDASTKLKRTLKDLKIKIQTLDVINYSDKFIYVRGRTSTLKKFGFVQLGNASALISGRKGRVICQLDGKLLCSGISLFRERGRTTFEQNLLYDFARNLFSYGKQTALELLGERARALAFGDVPKEDLLIRTIPSLEFDEYAYPALQRERTKAMIQLDAKKDEKIAYGYAIIHGESKVVRGERFLDDHVRSDIKYYQHRFFGERNLSEGTIGDLVSSVYGSKRTKQLRELLIPHTKAWF